MSANHGNTPAAWTGVVLVLVAFVVAGIALMVMSWPMFWIGVIIAPVGLIAAVIMSKTGHGATD
jgi:ABC-type bacteriocin/lantibiotic exporter with double-glycine peptidase domain